MSLKKVYAFGTITCYPELESYLKDKLTELGNVDVHVCPHLGQPYFEAVIEFTEGPIVETYLVDSSRISREMVKKGIFVNPYTGSCGISSSLSVTFIGGLPKAGKKICTFLFDLSLDSRILDESEHDVQLVQDAIDEFVEAVKVGFYYHQGGKTICRH